MGNKKKPSKKTAQNCEHGDGFPSDSNIRPASSIQDNIQSGDSVEIKEENDIKQEPVSVGELVDVAALTNRGAAYVPDFNEHDGGCDCDFTNLDEVKDEVKMECDDKKEEEPKANVDSGEDPMDNQPDQPMHDEVESVAPESIDIANSLQERDDDLGGIQSKPHECNIGKYSTQFKSNLNHHLLKHTGEKPHECNFCPKRFTRNQGLRAHMKVHVEEFLFHCSGCLQGFDVKTEKIEHETSCNIHRYECHLCRKSFGSMKANMIIHMRVHSGNRPFECKECFKQFTQKRNLNAYMKLHAGPRSFRCSNCRMGFQQESERNVHEEECNRPVFDCDICGKSFGLNKSHLVSHMRSHSYETPFECQSCSKQFSQKRSLNRHMKTHTKKLPFKCSICRQGFPKQTQCKAHERGCNRRCYECHLCKKSTGSRKTNMGRHMRTHSGEKPYQCQLCQSKFAQKGDLQKHVNRLHNKNC